MFLGGNRYPCGQGNKYDKQHEVALGAKLF